MYIVDQHARISRLIDGTEPFKFERAICVLQHGADVNRVNSYEQTALDIVSKFTANRAAHQIEQMLRGEINKDNKPGHVNGVLR